MKRKFELKLCKLLVACMTIPFFVMNSVPVHAEESYYFIPTYSVTAYQYFSNLGFQMTYADSSTTEYESYAITINTPQHTISNNTSSNNRYQCGAANNSAGFNMGCYVVDANGNHQDLNPDWTVPAVSETGTIARQYTVTDSIGNRYAKMIHTNYSRPIQYEASKHVDIGKDWFYIAFISDNGFKAPDVGWYSKTGSGYLNVQRFHYYVLQGLAFNVFRFKQEGLTNQGKDFDSYTIDWHFKTSSMVIPVYVGYESMMTDEVMQLLGIDTPAEQYLQQISNTITSTNNLIESGNANSQTVVNNAISANTELNNKVNQINSMETEFNDDMTDALNDIDINTDLVQHTGFTNAALWVASQFNRFIIGTPFELVITFALVTGLGLILLGRM